MSRMPGMPGPARRAHEALDPDTGHHVRRAERRGGACRHLNPKANALPVRPLGAWLRGSARLVLRPDELVQPRHGLPPRHRDRVRLREAPGDAELIQSLSAKPEDVRGVVGERVPRVLIPSLAGSPRPVHPVHPPVAVGMEDPLVKSPGASPRCPSATRRARSCGCACAPDHAAETGTASASSNS
jgi:hypothetical protein